MTHPRRRSGNAMYGVRTAIQPARRRSGLQAAGAKARIQPLAGGPAPPVHDLLFPLPLYRRRAPALDARLLFPADRGSPKVGPYREVEVAPSELQGLVEAAELEEELTRRSH